ncbi:MAG: hypothetical protein ABW128_21560, partial [Rhizorhabdus sp.]
MNAVPVRVKSSVAARRNLAIAAPIHMGLEDKAMRTASITRKTSETDIAVELNLDGSGVYTV